MKIDAMPTSVSRIGINHGADDVAAQIVAGAFEFRETLEDQRERTGGFTGAHHVDVQLGKMRGMRREAVGQRFAALQHAQDIGAPARGNWRARSAPR